jgi:hypothetical protein
MGNACPPVALLHRRRLLPFSRLVARAGGVPDDDDGARDDACLTPDCSSEKPNPSALACLPAWPSPPPPPPPPPQVVAAYKVRSARE